MHEREGWTQEEKRGEAEAESEGDTDQETRGSEAALTQRGARERAALRTWPATCCPRKPQKSSQSSLAQRISNGGYSVVYASIFMPSFIRPSLSGCSLNVMAFMRVAASMGFAGAGNGAACMRSSDGDDGSTGFGGAGWLAAASRGIVLMEVEMRWRRFWNQTCTRRSVVPMARAMASRCSFEGVALMPKALTRTAVENGEKAFRRTRIMSIGWPGKLSIGSRGSPALQANSLGAPAPQGSKNEFHRHCSFASLASREGGRENDRDPESGGAAGAQAGREAAAAYAPHPRSLSVPVSLDARALSLGPASRSASRPTYVPPIHHPRAATPVQQLDPPDRLLTVYDATYIR